MAVAHRMDVQAAIEETLSLIISFFGRIPDQLLEHECAILNRLELGETLAPNKYKELSGVARYSKGVGVGRNLRSYTGGQSPANVLSKVSPTRKSHLRLGRAVSA